MTRRLSGLLAALAIAVVAFAGNAKPAKALAPPRLTVTGASLIDADTGQQLYGVDATRRLPIASTTKLMTALVTLQHVHHLGTVFAQNDWTAAPADSQIGLVPGERMSVHDLLLALMLPSADDAAEDLAYNVGGRSVPRFVAMMNAEARALHLRDTHYSTPIGLDTPGNYSSPEDLDRLAAYAIAHSAFFRRIVSLPSAVLRTGRYRRTVTNRNDLVIRFPWIDGVKTGHTLQAGYVLVVSGRRNGMRLIGSVLGTSSIPARDANALALLDYGFAAFHVVEPVRAGQRLARVSVDGADRRPFAVVAATLKRVVARDDRVRVEVRLTRHLVAPLPRHAVVGHAVVLSGGRPIGSVALVLPRAVSAVSSMTRVIRFLDQPFTLLVVLLAAGLAFALGGTRRRRQMPMQRGQVEER